MNEEGYLLVWNEQDETHADLISKELYYKIKAMGENLEGAENIAFESDHIQTWFTQTYCSIPWPYNDIKILGTISIPRT